MSGWKKWAALEVVQATQFQDYVQDQVVQVYAGTAARSSALGTSVAEGMVSYLSDINQVQVYNGSSWVEVGGTAVAYATASGTAVYATNAGTSVYATTSGTSVYSTNAGTSVYATTSGTADYSVLSGTAVTISGSIGPTQVTGTAVTTADTATVTNAMLAGSIENAKLLNSTITLNGTAVALGGSATISGGGGTADFSNPMTVLGDLIVGGTGGTAERLGIGSANTFLFSNGTVASWNTVGTAGYSTTSGTAVYATNAGTAVYATNAGTSVYATNAGTAVYATTSGTSVSISGNIAPTQVTAGTFNAGSFAFSTAVTTGNTLTTGNAMRNITMSTADPTGGADGDVWLKYTP